MSGYEKLLIPSEKWLNYLQTVETLIRCHILWHLIWVCTVCQLPFYGSPDYNGLTFHKNVAAGIFFFKSFSEGALFTCIRDIFRETGMMMMMMMIWCFMPLSTKKSGYFSYFSMKTYVVVLIRRAWLEVLLISTHNIFFTEKYFFPLIPLIIWSYVYAVCLKMNASQRTC